MAIGSKVLVFRLARQRRKREATFEIMRLDRTHRNKKYEDYKSGRKFVQEFPKDNQRRKPRKPSKRQSSTKEVWVAQDDGYELAQEGKVLSERFAEANWIQWRSDGTWSGDGTDDGGGDARGGWDEVEDCFHEME